MDMRRPIAVVVMIETIFLLSIFAEIYTTTGGGPGIATTDLSYLIYSLGLQQFDIGLASAGGILAVILANIVSFFLVRMLVFLVLCALVMVALYKQIILAFFANPGLNALIGAVLAIGTILSFRQVIRLYPEVAWVNNFRIADPGLAVDRHPTLLAPMAAILGGERTGRMTISQQTMRHLLDSIATRLDEARDISRYMTGLLVFLGLLGTFWGLIETVGSGGKVIDGLKVGGDAGALFDTLKEGLAAPLGGMGISFSSSLFGLAGSLILGFLDLQSSQAQNRFYTDLEDWLASTVREYSGESAAGASGDLQNAIERLRAILDRPEELSAAETVVGAYQDAPERQAMLTSLAALHRKAQ